MNDPALEGGDYWPCYAITFGEDGKIERVKFSGEHTAECGTKCVTSVKHESFSVWGPNAGSAMPSSNKRRGNAPIKCEK